MEPSVLGLTLSSDFPFAASLLLPEFQSRKDFCLGETGEYHRSQQKIKTIREESRCAPRIEFPLSMPRGVNSERSQTHLESAQAPSRPADDAREGQTCVFCAQQSTWELRCPRLSS